MKSRAAGAAAVRYGNDFATEQLLAALADLRAKQQGRGFEPVARKEMLPQLIGDLLRKHQRTASLHRSTSRRKDSSTSARCVASVSRAASHCRWRDQR